MTDIADTAQLVYTSCIGEYDGKPCLFYSYTVNDGGEPDLVTIVFLDDVKRLPAEGLIVFTKPEEESEDGQE